MTYPEQILEGTKRTLVGLDKVHASPVYLNDVGAASMAFNTVTGQSYIMVVYPVQSEVKVPDNKPLMFSDIIKDN